MPRSSEAVAKPSRIAPAGYYCEGLCVVTLSQVLANMADFDGVRVYTQGYLQVAYASNVLFASREDFEGGTGNGTRLQMPADPEMHQYADLDGRYVTVIGRYQANPVGLGNGSLIVEKVVRERRARRKARD